MIRQKYFLWLIGIMLIVLNMSLNHRLSSNHLLVRAVPTVISSQVLEASSMGYQNLIATYIWFKTIAYFGASENEINVIDLASLLRNITTLNQKFSPAYYMAATVLPWHTGTTTLSQPFVLQAMIEFPDDWRWAYYRGFNSYWFDHNSELAAHYFELSAMKPHAPPLVTSLALRMHSHAGNLQTGLEFLKDLLQKKNDAKLQAQLLKQYRELQTEQQLRAIETLFAKLPKRHEDMSDLKKLRHMGYKLPTTLADGGTIQMLKDGSLLSSKTKKRFKLFVPKKRQGVENHAAH